MNPIHPSPGGIVVLGEHSCEHPQAERIWFTRPADIADHIEALPPGTVPGDPRAAA